MRCAGKLQREEEGKGRAYGRKGFPHEVAVVHASRRGSLFAAVRRSIGVRFSSQCRTIRLSQSWSKNVKEHVTYYRTWEYTAAWLGDSAGNRIDCRAKRNGS